MFPEIGVQKALRTLVLTSPTLKSNTRGKRMNKLLGLINPFIGYRAYVIGPLLVILGVQFANHKLLAILYVIAGMSIMVARPFIELQPKK